jgi:hypothetical protein
MIVSLLRRLMRIPEPVSIDHPVFGRMTWIKPGYWEAAYEEDGAPVGVTVDVLDGDQGGPSAAQVAFFERIRREPEIAFRMGEPLLRAEYESWIGEPCPADWRTVFRFAGFSVPADGSEQGEWDAVFDCLTDAAGHSFTCWFENGAAVGVSVDG